jgi:parallel beta-helix repeat protein
MKGRGGLGWLATLAVGVIWLATGSASAKDLTVACGSEITEDTVLVDDVLDCENGVRITAPGVSFDLNGHRIAGRGAGAGVRVSASGVEIKRGVISGFDVGIIAFGERRLRILDNTIHHNRTGLELFMATDARVVRNRILKNAAGVHAVRADGSRLEGNLIAGNSGHGALLLESTVTVSRNTFSGNGGDGLEIDDVCYPGVALYRVGSNVASGNGALGMNLHFGGCPPPTEPNMLGDVDVGRNVAVSNADPRECLLVSCVRRQARTP